MPGRHRRRLAGQPARQPGGVHPQRCQARAKLVTQLTRQPGPLVLVQAQQLLAQQAAPLFGLVERAGQVAQRGGQQRQLVDRHRRQRQHGLRVAALDAADGRQQPAQRCQRPAQVPAHRQQQAGDAGQQQRQRAQQIDHRLAALALVRCRQADLPARRRRAAHRAGQAAPPVGPVCGRRQTRRRCRCACAASPGPAPAAAQRRPPPRHAASAGAAGRWAAGWGAGGGWWGMLCGTGGRREGQRLRGFRE